ncbi:MAG: hypothetical protein ACYC5G_05735, partial [Candidatus Doudnabacteria bacterium]
MKLVRIGNVILNMDNIIAVKDNGEQIILFFAGSTSENILSTTLDGENALQIRKWLCRNGVNDLSTETPKFSW